MANNVWETNELMTIPLEEAEDRLAFFVNEAAKQQVVITAAGRPVAVLIGFADEDEWFEYRLLQDRRFKQRIAEARAQAMAGQLTRMEDLPV